MNWLLDVNLLLATRWTTHPDHIEAAAWLDSVEEFYTSPITELGFLRVSLSPGYGATWEAVSESLGRLRDRRSFRFLVDDVDASSLPRTSYKDTTDSHLVVLAKRHGLMLATLDMALVAKPWASGVAVNPLVSDS